MLEPQVCVQAAVAKLGARMGGVDGARGEAAAVAPPLEAPQLAVLTAAVAARLETVLGDMD